jgi:hypothetical protein
MFQMLEAKRCFSRHLNVLYACILQGGAKKDVISATFYNTYGSPKFNYEILIIWFCCIRMEAQGRAIFGGVESYVFFVGTFVILDVMNDIS